MAVSSKKSVNLLLTDICHKQKVGKFATDRCLSVANCP